MYIQLIDRISCKYANVLFTMELNKRFNESGVITEAIDHGVVNTEISRNYTGIIAWIQKRLAPLFPKTPEQGASTTLYSATLSNIHIHDGEYYRYSLDI